MLADLREAQRELDERDTPFRRRGYVRTLFACIEGFVAALRQMAILNPEKFEPEELVLLRETTPFIGDKGKIRQKQNKVALRDALPFSFNSYMKLGDSQTRLDGDEEWDNFLKAIQIRDRVTHPKSVGDFSLSDADMERMGRITKWLPERTLKGFLENTPRGAVLVVAGLLLLAAHVWGAEYRDGSNDADHWTASRRGQPVWSKGAPVSRRSQ